MVASIKYVGLGEHYISMKPLGTVICGEVRDEIARRPYLPTMGEGGIIATYLSTCPNGGENARGIVASASINIFLCRACAQKAATIIWQG